MDGFTPGSAGNVTSKVEIGFSCRGVHDADIFSKSDPMVVLYTKSSDNGPWVEFGRTEIIWDNLNPDFEKKFILEYRQDINFAA